jgi:oligopeptide transport system permease protein
MIGTCVFVAFVLLAIFAPMLSDANSTTSDLANQLQGPSANHWFGTDFQGRDMWKRAWEGARISLAIAFAVAGMILVIGTIYGSISGYVGGRLDNAMMRLLDALYGLPYLPFAIIFVTVLKESLPRNAPPVLYMVPALALTTWFTAARIIRSQVLSLKQNEYVESADSQGARWPRIISKHILPNAIGIFIVAIFLEIPAAILGEATLSFLGLGVEIPASSWGAMAQGGYDFFRTDPHMIAVPGLLIAITVLSTIAMADGLRDALDPRQGK